MSSAQFQLVARPPVDPRYLADTSALARMRYPAVAAFLGPLIEQGLVARCALVDLEILYTARNAADLAEMRRERALAFPLVPTLQEDHNRAIDVMELLAAAHKYRSVKVPDLVIAAIAERASLTVVHYDADFDHVAGVTGQETRWVAPRGSLEPSPC